MPRGKNTNVWMTCQECDMQNYVERVNERTLGGEKLIVKKFCPKDNKHTKHKSGKKITHAAKK